MAELIDHPGNQSERLMLEPLTFAGTIAVAARSGQAAELVRRLGAQTGLALIDGPVCAANETYQAWGVAPGRWLIFARSEGGIWPQSMMTLLAGCGSVFDQSAASALWRLSGKEAGSLLQKGLFVDLDPSRFPIGRCCTARAAQITISTARVDDTIWEIAVPRSYAGSFLHWLRTASANSRILMTEKGAHG